MEINIVDGIVNIRFIMVGLRAGKWSEDSGRILHSIHMCVHIIGAHKENAPLCTGLLWSEQGQASRRRTVEKYYIAHICMIIGAHRENASLCTGLLWSDQGQASGQRTVEEYYLVYICMPKCTELCSNLQMVRVQYKVHMNIF